MCQPDQTQKQEILNDQAKQSETAVDTSAREDNEVIPAKVAEINNPTKNRLAMADGAAKTVINGNPMKEVTKGS